MTRSLTVTVMLAILLITGPVCALADTGEGTKLFARECAICHSESGFGTMMLARRLGADRSLLRERTDLVPDYVKTVVRHGLASMPPLSRVEVSDDELQAIIVYLTDRRTVRRNE